MIGLLFIFLFNEETQNKCIKGGLDDIELVFNTRDNGLFHSGMKMTLIQKSFKGRFLVLNYFCSEDFHFH